MGLHGVTLQKPNKTVLRDANVIAALYLNYLPAFMKRFPLKYFFVYMEVERGKVVANCNALRQVTDPVNCSKEYSDTGVSLNRAGYVTETLWRQRLC